MSIPARPPALQQFVDDEILRAPLLFDQLVDGTIDHARKALPTMQPAERSTIGHMMQALLGQRSRLADYFLRALREQVEGDLARRTPSATGKGGKRSTLALVDEDEVALNVELSHTIEAIKSTAEYELRELETYVSALVGDLDVTSRHNPFSAETYARAVWAAAQAMPVSRGHQVAFMRHAGEPLAQLLRKTCAAASSRLESMGVEPAAYRTLILPSGSRRGPRGAETTFVPDLHRMRDTMPAPLDAPLSYEGQTAGAAPARPGSGEHWSEIARGTTNRIDRQSIELVSRLFEAMLADERVPVDVGRVISRLQGPAMRLAVRDGGMLDENRHPLWRYINRLAFEAEMAPDAADPDRVLLLKHAQSSIDQLAADPQQNALYGWALDRLDAFLHKRLTRRLTAAASQIGALQKLEDKLASGQAAASSFHGILDFPELDTVPADLLDEEAIARRSPASTDGWLDSLRPGDWVRMFLQGRWIHARLLWRGERREVWLFGDGASDTTWAVRRGALLNMHAERLAKTLKQRSIVGSAAVRLQEQMTTTA